MSRFRTLLVLSLLALLCAGLAFGQAVNATLLGTVTDASGAVVPNAKVTITEVNTGVSRSGQTNESGNYTFPDLPPGQYSVTVEAAGFKKETRRDIALLVNTTQRVDIQLQPGNVYRNHRGHRRSTGVADGPRRYRPQHRHDGGVGTAGSGQQPQLSSPAGPRARHVAADGAALPVL